MSFCIPSGFSPILLNRSDNRMRFTFEFYICCWPLCNNCDQTLPEKIRIDHSLMIISWTFGLNFFVALNMVLMRVSSVLSANLRSRATATNMTDDQSKWHWLVTPFLPNWYATLAWLIFRYILLKLSAQARCDLK